MRAEFFKVIELLIANGVITGDDLLALLKANPFPGVRDIERIVSTVAAATPAPVKGTRRNGN